VVQIARSKVTLKGIRLPIWRRLDDLVARCPFFDPKPVGSRRRRRNRCSGLDRVALAEQDERR
jgi:hypothetical protein